MMVRTSETRIRSPGFCLGALWLGSLTAHHRDTWVWRCHMARTCGLPVAMTVDTLDTEEPEVQQPQLHCDLMRGIGKRILISRPEPCSTETVRE